MEMVNLHGQTDQSMKATFYKTSLKEKDKCSGQIRSTIKESGRLIKWMERALSNGPMEEYMLVSIIKIKNMDQAELTGLMEKPMKDSGDREFNMDKEDSRAKMLFGGKAYGKMEKGFNESNLILNQFYSSFIIQ